MTKNIGPTDEQKQIINMKGNVVVTAKPGSGKTYTIVEKIRLISEQLYDYQGVIAISFTRKASHELEMRCTNKNIPRKQSFYGTIDHFYISQIIFPFSKQLTKKINQLEVRASINDYPEFKELEKIKKETTPELEKMLVDSLTKGHIFLDICGETALYILSHVKESIGYLLSRFTHIFIDEYQDCGKIQHEIFLLLIHAGMNGIAVGDINQAIYAFSNRYPEYLVSLIKRPDFNHYEITKNHRCHKSISDYSLNLMGIDIKEPTDDLRVFEVIVKGDEKAIACAIDKQLPQIEKKYNIQHNNQVGILCRNNGTAERINEHLKIPSKLFVETELDRYNAYWARFFNDFLQCYFDANVFNVDFVDRYLNEESNSHAYQKAIRLVDGLFALDDINLIAHISDIVDLAKIIYPEYENKEVISILTDILSDETKLHSYKPSTNEEVNILTLHKSKGLEFNIVFHLDLYRWIMPPYKASEEDYEQALNLHYVGVTRAKDACYIMQGNERHISNGELRSAEESPFLQIEDLSNLRKTVTWKLD